MLACVTAIALRDPDDRRAFVRRAPVGRRLPYTASALGDPGTPLLGIVAGRWRPNPTKPSMRSQSASVNVWLPAVDVPFATDSHRLEQPTRVIPFIATLTVILEVSEKSRGKRNEPLSGFKTRESA